VSETGNDGRVRSIDRVVAILKTFTPDDPERGVSDIARASGLTISTTHRLLGALQVHDLVEQDAKHGGYRLGPGLLRLAHGVRSASHLQAFAKPVMTWLRDDLEETVGLHLYRAPAYRYVVDQVESRQALRRTYTEIDTPLPIHQGAPGKVLLAYLPEAQRERILENPLSAATSSTITDPVELRAALGEIRARGYGISLQERVVGISTLAVPIFDDEGEVSSCLSVSGPAVRLSEERLHEIADLAARAASTISAHLGYLEIEPGAAGA
jgi:IclR family transcriptional regulator, acetate operon repressor